MKIRVGFVSNSSSSSFVALIPKEEWAKIFQCLSADVITALNEEHCIKTVNFSGVDCISVSFSQGNYNTFEDCSNYIDEPNMEQLFEDLEQLQDDIRRLKNKQVAFVKEIDF